MMKTSLFDYCYPRSRIATRPARPRDEAKLLILDRLSRMLRHKRFKDITDFVRPGDCVVLNDTKVLPARLEGRKEPTGGRVGLLLSKRASEHVWEALIRPGRIHSGTRLSFGQNGYAATVGERLNGNGSWQVRLSRRLSKDLTRVGQVPLPPYMKRPARARDKEWYQTVYASAPGSIAAPTAGLHFTHRLIRRLYERGVNVVSVTCHIGYATFASVVADEIDGHVMHAETYSISQKAVQTIRQTKVGGGRVFSVGTSSTRVLETLGPKLFRNPGHAQNGTTRLFIRPPFRFQVVDALVTNFHMPRTTLLMLVSAFAGRRRILDAYRKAVQGGYRLFSYGDAMLII